MKVFLKPTLGLCNRMRVIATVYERVKSKNGKLVVLWDLDSGLNCDMHKLFSLPGDVRIITFKSVRNIFDKVYYKFVYKYLNLTTKLIPQNEVITAIRASKDIIQNRALIESYAALSADWRTYDFSIFKPTEEITNMVRNRVDRITAGGGFKYIGLHIRRTDNVESIKQSRSEMFYTLLDEYFSKYADIRVYVASDSIEEREELHKRYNKDVERVFFSENMVTGRDSEAGIVEAYVELLTLAQAEKIYGSHFSSYSETAATLYNRPLFKVSEEEMEAILKQI